MATVSTGGRVDTIYTDLRKAFDSVNHRLLIKKLENIGISDSLLSWLDFYLVNRRQIVKIRNSLSSTINVVSGVPQGSHLSPLLFLIFMNDIGNIFLYSRFLKFADDLKIYLPIYSIEDSLKLQSDLSRFHTWCEHNGLHITASKCTQISFTRRKSNHAFSYNIENIKLTNNNYIKDLGVILSSDLSFTKHIELMVNKA